MSTQSGSLKGPRAFTIGLRIVAGFAMVTGLIDIVAGTAILPLMGATLSAGGADPVLDSQFRFLSATWLGYGLALWWVTGDLASRGAMLSILAFAMLAGGAGRLISLATTGVPSVPIFVFLGIELVGPVMAVLIHRKLFAARPATR